MKVHAVAGRGMPRAVNAPGDLWQYSRGTTLVIVGELTEHEAGSWAAALGAAATRGCDIRCRK